MNLASSSTGIIKNIKKEPEDKNKKSSTSGGNNTTGSKDSGTKLSAAGEYKLKKTAENLTTIIDLVKLFSKSQCLVVSISSFFFLKLLKVFYHEGVSYKTNTVFIYLILNFSQDH